MYVWLWRHLPGPAAVRALQCLVLFAAVAALLVLVVFPEVEPLLPYQEVTVDPRPTGDSPASPAP